MTSCLAPSPAVMSSLATTDDQVGAVDAEDFLGLSLGDERAERKGFGVSGRWGVHGSILHCEHEKKRENNRSAARHLGSARGLFNTESRAGSGRYDGLLGAAISFFSTCL